MNPQALASWAYEKFCTVEEEAEQELAEEGTEGGEEIQEVHKLWPVYKIDC